MDRTQRKSVLGPAVFIATLLGALVFFWWLLIYHHGIPGAGEARFPQTEATKVQG